MFETMPKTRGTTTERGLGNAHQQERRRLLPLAWNTDCPLCGRVMYEGDRLDLDHRVPRAFGGQPGNGRIVHASCNRAEGPRIRAALHRSQRRRWEQAEPQSRRW